MERACSKVRFRQEDPSNINSSRDPSLDSLKNKKKTKQSGLSKYINSTPGAGVIGNEAMLLRNARMKKKWQDQKRQLIEDKEKKIAQVRKQQAQGQYEDLDEEKYEQEEIRPCTRTARQVMQKILQKYEDKDKRIAQARKQKAQQK